MYQYIYTFFIFSFIINESLCCSLGPRQRCFSSPVSFQTFLPSGRSVLSRSALLRRPPWSRAPPPSWVFGRELKLHQICRRPVPNHPKSPSPWNWISWLSCTVPAFLVSDHQVVVICYLGGGGLLKLSFLN